MRMTRQADMERTSDNSKRSKFFAQVFAQTGVCCEWQSDGKQIYSGKALRCASTKASLRLYFVDATSNHQAYFAAKTSCYDPNALTHWQRVRFEDPRFHEYMDTQDCEAIIPVPGQEEEAMREAVRVASG